MRRLSYTATGLLCALLLTTSVQAQRAATQPSVEGVEDIPVTPRATDGTASSRPTTVAGPLPFGAQLFAGNFSEQRNERLNPDYEIAPGDRVAIKTWGAVEIVDVFIVDGQGNIFLPRIGPIQLAGVRHADLTQVVRSQIRQTYSRNVDVYTNLLSAAPVMVYVTGHVAEPGRYGGAASDSVLFFLDHAGGIDPQAGSYRDIRVLRNGELIADLDLYDFLLKGLVPSVQLADGDSVLVGPRGPTVTIDGDVAVPRVIEFDSTSFTGSDALEIVRSAALASEVTVHGASGKRASANTFSLEAFADYPLKDGDVVTVRQDRRSESILVTLEGEFEGPSILSVQRGARLVDVLNYIPVREGLANTDAVHIKRLSVAQAQKRAIDDSLFRLERVALLSLSQSNGEADIRLKEAELMKQFIASARLIQPLGRVVTAGPKGQKNALLEDGDIIVIPRRTNVIRVAGEVQLTQAFLYEKDLVVEDYIDMAGGFTDRAQKRRVLVMHADASVSVGDEDAPVRPGDELLVTPKVDHKRLQNTMDITQIVYQIAVAAGVAMSPIIAAR